MEHGMRKLKNPILEAFVLIVVWILCLLFGAADPTNVYGGF